MHPPTPWFENEHRNTSSKSKWASTRRCLVYNKMSSRPKLLKSRHELTILQLCNKTLEELIFLSKLSHDVTGSFFGFFQPKSKEINHTCQILTSKSNSYEINHQPNYKSKSQKTSNPA